MAIYLVAYDILNEAGTQDYEPLWHELKVLGAQPVQDGVWLLENDQNEDHVAQRLRAYLDLGDRLLVTQIHNGEFCQSHSRLGTDAWLAARWPSSAYGQADDGAAEAVP